MNPLRLELEIDLIDFAKEFEDLTSEKEIVKDPLILTIKKGT